MIQAMELCFKFHIFQLPFLSSLNKSILKEKVPSLAPKHDVHNPYIRNIRFIYSPLPTKLTDPIADQLTGMKCGYVNSQHMALPNHIQQLYIFYSKMKDFSFFEQGEKLEEMTTSSGTLAEV